MTCFLKSRLSRIVIALPALFLMALLLKATLSYILYRSRPKIENHLINTLGYRLTIEKISFSFLNRLHLREVCVFYEDEKETPILIKDASLYIKIFPAFLGRLSINKIRIDEILLPIKKEEEGYSLQIMFSNIYKKISEIETLKSRISTNKIIILMKLVKFIFIDVNSPEENRYVLLKNAKIELRQDTFKFNGNTELYYQLPEDAYLSKFFKNKKIRQELECAVQGNIKGKNLNMNLIVLTIGKGQILGTGIEKDFTSKNPFVDVTFIPSSISINNVVFLRDNFDAEGDMFISLKLNGLLDNVRPIVNTLLDNCNLRCELSNSERLDVKNMSGELEYGNDRIKFNRVFLKVNSLPLNIKLEANASEENNITLDISLPKEFLHSQSLYLDRLKFVFNGKIKNTLRGELEIDSLYATPHTDLNIRAYFKDIDFDYRQNEKYFKADTVELIKDNAYGIQKLRLSDLKTAICLGKNRIEAKELNFKGYNGIIRGAINLDIKDKGSSLTLVLKGSGIDAKALMQDISVSNKLLAGIMNINIAFDNRLNESLMVRCYIENGAVDLNTFASAVKFPSLKNVEFNIMHIFFSISRDIIKIRGARLSSPDIKLNAYWDTNGKIKGVFNLKLSYELLKQSAEFRKLLKLTKIKKPYIDFKFLLGGIPEAVRFMWLKGEFREKLRSALPEGIKKSIESRLDKMIETVSNK